MHKEHLFATCVLGQTNVIFHVMYVRNIRKIQQLYRIKNLWKGTGDCHVCK